VDGSEARLSGYLSALRQAGEEIDESLIIHVDFTYEGGRAAAHSLLDRPDRPSAIFAASDEIALGVMEEARRRSIRVPEDLSIVGFDDTFLASRSTPPLTTVAQPLHDMGRIAVRLLVEEVQGQASVGHVELATHLVLRDSTSSSPRTATGEAVANGRKKPPRRAPNNTGNSSVRRHDGQTASADDRPGATAKVAPKP